MNNPGDVVTNSRTNGNGDEAPVSLEKKFFNIRTFVSFGVAFAILYFFVRQMNLNVAEVARNIASANPALYLAGMAIYYTTFLVRGLRWRLLLENVGFGEDAGRKLPSVLGMAEIIFLSWFANCIMPAKLGDAYRAYLLKRNAPVSFSKTIGTVLAERILDLLVTFVLLGVTWLTIFHGTLPPEILIGMQASLAVAVAVVLGLLAMRNLGTLIRKVIPKRFRHYYGLLEEGTLRSFQQLPLVVGYTLLAWLIEATRLYFVVLSLGLVGVGFPIILFTAIAGSLLTTVPITPAGIGFVEGGIIGILMVAGRLGLVAGLDQNLVSSIAILDRAISYWSLVLFGLVLYLVTKKK